MAKKAAARKPMIVPSSLAGAKKAPMPKSVEAKLATLAKEAPQGDGWVHEIKFDGYRMLCHIDKGKAQFASRNQKSWTKQLDFLGQVALELPVKQVIFDGEVVAFRRDGVTDFQTLQNVFSEGRVNELVYYVFDLLYLNGIDLRGVPLVERKRLLEQLLPRKAQKGAVRYSEHFEGNASEFFKQASLHGLEGIICKLKDKPYTAGRSYDWLKVKASHREEFVIGGFTDPGIRGGFGALLLGYHDKEGRLLYAGKVGTGFTDKMLESLRKRLDRMARKESPFADLRKATGEGRGAHWVQPQLVGQVAFTEWTRDGHLRHPSFLGLREDKPAHTVVRDNAIAVSQLPEPATIVSKGPKKGARVKGG